MKPQERVNLYLHAFLTISLGVRKWSASRPGWSTPEKDDRFPSNRLLNGTQRKKRLFGEEKNLFHMPGFQRRTSQPVVSSLY